MAVINNAQRDVSLTPEQIIALNHYFWRWYYQNSERVWFSIKRKIFIFPVSISIKTSHLQPVFVAIFGEPPFPVPIEEV